MLTVWQLDPAQTTAYYNAALCNALVRAGCRVRYLTSPYLFEDALPLESEVQIDYFYPLLLPHGLLRRVRALRRVVRAATYAWGHGMTVAAAQRTPPDVLHMQWSRWPRLDKWLILQFQQMNIPIIYTAHDVIPLFAPDARQAYGDIYAAVDRVIVHNEVSQRAFAEAFPRIPPRKLRVIPLIGAPNRATPSTASRDDARRALGVPDDVPVILFFGTIRAYKGLPTLVAAYQLAAQQHPNLWLVVAGQAETTQDALPLQALAGHPRVRLHNHFIAYDAMWHYFMAADVVVFPYEAIYESGALIDALGFGCPVIVTDVGGLPRAVDGNGWVVAKGDVSGLARTLGEAVADPHQLARMGEQSRRLHKSTYNEAAVAAQTLQLYEEYLHDI